VETSFDNSNGIDGTSKLTAYVQPCESVNVPEIVKPATCDDELDGSSDGVTTESLPVPDSTDDDGTSLDSARDAADDSLPRLLDDPDDEHPATASIAPITAAMAAAAGIRPLIRTP
jgi:hypothetical protein